MATRWISALLFAQQVIAASIASLPSYPLAVKSPYLSTWLPSTGVNDVARARPEFWTGQNINWPILARVDGKAYALLNSPPGLTGGLTAARTLDVNYTSTHTLITLAADNVNFTLDFFSPIFPRNLTLHSLPYSYLTVSVATPEPKDVQVFSAIDYTWTQQKGAANINYTTTKSTEYFRFFNEHQIPFNEVEEMAAWGSVIFGTTSGKNVTRASSSPQEVFETFVHDGNLAKVVSTEAGSNIASISKDLGLVGVKGASVTFGVGFQRDLAIQYLEKIETGYHRTVWPTIEEAFEFFMSNYDDAHAYSTKFDQQVRSKAESVSKDWGADYGDIVEASVRQCFGAYELTVPFDNLTAEPWAFLKEISSDGNVNTVDLIFQSWHIFVSLNPEWIKMQLLPVLNYLNTGRWPRPFVIHDIGTHYPKATGHDNGIEENMPLFETSSMLTLLYAYQTLTHSTSLTDPYLHLLTGWADFLVQHSLYPAKQLTSVDSIPPSANQTGLTIQSIIGLKAAGYLLNNSHYLSIADNYTTILYDHGLGLSTESPNHFTYNYGHESSTSVLFPFFASTLFPSLATFPPSALEMQSNYYLHQLNLTPAGIPYATSPATIPNGVDWAITDWNIVYAAASGNEELRKKVVESTWRFMTNGMNSIPFGTKYAVRDHRIGKEKIKEGKWLGNKARSTTGGHFAILAVEQGVWEDVGE